MTKAEMSERGKWSGADARGFVASVQRDRDELWCTALISALPIEQVDRVLGVFQQIRPDSGPPLGPGAEPAGEVPRG